jgi:hypothetical protein
MTMAQLIITGCTDPLLWYAERIGKTCEVLRNLPGEACWLAREPAGFSNIVYHRDATALPDGYHVVDRKSLIQRGDLVLTDGRWLSPALLSIGTPAHNHIVIRKD